MLTLVIADDEQPAIDELSFLLSQDSRIDHVFAAKNARSALELIREHEPDGVFLDIHMPGLSGLDVAAQLRALPTPPAIVFVTADEDKALDAFDLQATDYLLKPVRPARLAEALRRIQQFTSQEPADMVTVDQAGVSKRIRQDEILYVQAQGDYARLHTRDSSYLIRVPMSELEEQWRPSGFIRIHRSYLVALAHLDEVRTTGTSGTTSGPSVSVGGAQLPISRRHLPQVRSELESTRVRPR
ncbi:LytR/AlgR family response regulator transcription factor [Haematomicrobium sanguinis]|uniref:LytR/AlgR family response regulator transcription factor n=1 Tax=Haematomicrobium sanguinis TaxID=479106 RepID=UPI00047AA9FB|nr:LytTR family DNA-binding domain-containing protein [Haematomicrobium sanguinis]